MKYSDLPKLLAPFVEDEVFWRVARTNRDNTKAQALCYVDARAIQARLDSVCGPVNWRAEFFHLYEDTVICALSIRVDGEWISKQDGGGRTNFEAEKGQLSVALRRAAVQWGIGRYLYELGNTCVSCNERKQFTDGAQRELAKRYAILLSSVRDRFGEPIESYEHAEDAQLQNASEYTRSQDTFEAFSEECEGNNGVAAVLVAANKFFVSCGFDQNVVTRDMVDRHGWENSMDIPKYYVTNKAAQVRGIARWLFAGFTLDGPLTWRQHCDMKRYSAMNAIGERDSFRACAKFYKQATGNQENVKEQEHAEEPDTDSLGA